MLWMKCKLVVDFMRGLRRKMPCSLWFLLLFSAGGLVLFIHQRDLLEMVHQQGQYLSSDPDPIHFTGVKLSNIPRQSRETLSTQDRDRGKPDNYHPEAEGVLSSPIPPMQFPNFEESRQMATLESREHDMGSVHVSKRYRKLLKTSPQIPHNHNNGFSSTHSSSSLVSSPSALGSFSPESWKKLFDIKETRQQLMKKMCAKYKSSISRTITPHHVKELYVEDKYKLLYCQVPKAGCSNWKRTLMVLAGKAPNAQSIKHEDVHEGNHLRKLNSFDQQEILYRLTTYTKVMFVREPLEKMVSAYRDKFENPNKYYHTLFGKHIIAKYRKNPSRTALETGNGVTFKEFVQYVLDVHRPVGMDVHWEQVNQLCNPCLIDYDFIGKFENMKEESDFVLRLIGAPPNITLPTFKDRNPGDKRTSLNITQKYFSQVSTSERQRVYDFYYMDYLMFNYSKPFKDLY